MHLPHLIGPMKHYLWILKTCHSGADMVGRLLGSRGVGGFSGSMGPRNSRGSAILSPRQTRPRPHPSLTPAPLSRPAPTPPTPKDTAAEMAKGYMDEETRWMLFDMLGHRDEWWAGFSRGAAPWPGLSGGRGLVSRHGWPPQAPSRTAAHPPVPPPPNPPPPPPKRWVPGKIADIRARIAPAVRAPGASRDLMLLDIALDTYFRWGGGSGVGGTNTSFATLSPVWPLKLVSPLQPRLATPTPGPPPPPPPPPRRPRQDVHRALRLGVPQRRQPPRHGRPRAAQRDAHGGRAGGRGEGGGREGAASAGRRAPGPPGAELPPSHPQGHTPKNHT
jgi:hypothetical protein